MINDVGIIHMMGGEGIRGGGATELGRGRRRRRGMRVLCDIVSHING